MVATINLAINLRRQNMPSIVFELLSSAVNLGPIESSQRVLSIGATFTTELNNLNMLMGMFCIWIFIAKLMVATIAVFVGWSLRKCDLPTKMASPSRDITIRLRLREFAQITIVKI